MGKLRDSLTKRGKFLNDMKLAKLGGNLTTATFKN